MPLSILKQHSNLINRVDIQKNEVEVASKSVINLILGFVGKTHTPRFCRIFNLTHFGAL